MHKILFYNKFIKRLYTFQTLCVHHQEVKTVYTASGIITPVGGRPVSCEQVEKRPVHGMATYRCDDTRSCIYNFDLLMMST